MRFAFHFPPVLELKYALSRSVCNELNPAGGATIVSTNLVWHYVKGLSSSAATL